LLINFWAYWCPNCMTESSPWKVFRRPWAASRLAVLLVSDPKYWQTDRLVARQRGIPFPLAYYDPNWTPPLLARVLFGRANGATVYRALPVSYVFVPSGAPALALIGSEDWTNPQHRNFWLGLMTG
jgi:thiol-disulfide isomerase/thioredoxin